MRHKRKIYGIFSDVFINPQFQIFHHGIAKSDKICAKKIVKLILGGLASFWNIFHPGI